MLVVGAPIIFFAMPRGRRAATTPAAGAAPAAELPGVDFRAALRGIRFWMVAAISLLIGAGVGATVVFLPLVGLSRGMSPTDVAGAAGLMGLAAIVGRLLSGVFLDRLPVRFVAAVIFALPVVACAVLIGVKDVAGLTLVGVLLGVSSGGDFNVLAMLTGRYFRRAELCRDLRTGRGGLQHRRRRRSAGRQPRLRADRRLRPGADAGSSRFSASPP
jgi:predicted MFS family arabinose efflux permease